jgi:hypothetical protein
MIFQTLLFHLAITNVVLSTTDKTTFDSRVVCNYFENGCSHDVSPKKMQENPLTGFFPARVITGEPVKKQID